MADHNKGGFISKAQKRLTRTKTKVLQNLGKAEKTADEKFDEHVHKLDKQQEVAHRFQKELRNYIHCAKAMEVASKSFFSVMLETYEEDWKDHTQLRDTLQSLELMWADYVQHLHESVQDPLTTYTNHFAPLKQRIAKRNRKLDYFDNARHNAEVQQNAKKKDDVKITKANEELEESKRIFEVLNNELHNELPEFFNSRINFYASTFKSFFNAESTFHGETGKLNDTAMAISEKLAEDHKQYTYQPRPLSGVMTNDFPWESVVNGNSSGDNDSTHSTPTPSKRDKTSPKPDRPPSSPAASLPRNTEMTPGSTTALPGSTAVTPSGSVTTPLKTNSEGLVNGLSEPDSPPESPLYENSELNTTPINTEQLKTQKESESRNHVEDEADSYEEPVVNELPAVNGPPKESVKDNIETDGKSDETDLPSYPPPQPPAEPPEPPKVPPPEDEDNIPSKSVEINQEDSESDHYYDKVPDQIDDKQNKDSDDDDDNLYEIPSSSKIPDVLPDGCMYVVVATHLYKNEDDDELSFEAGELIYVMPFDDPDDQDDGWLMGVKKSDGKKGVFPENFTKRV